MYVGPNEVTVLLSEKASKRLAGFTTAHIFSQQPDLARIDMTGVASEKRGKKLVGILLDELEKKLRERGVQFVTRQSRITDGYADAVERHYKDRIIEKKEPEEGSADPKRYFKIRL